MGALRLPFHPLWLESISPRGPEVSALFSLAPSVADRLDGAVDVVARYRPIPGFGLWYGSGLPCFMVSLLMVCPALRPRPCPRTSHRGPRVSPPLSQRRRPSGTSLISWLNNTAFHLAVYASCRPFRTTMQDSLSVRRYSLTGRIRTCLGGVAAFPALRQSPGFALSFRSFVSVIRFLSGSCFRGVSRRHAFARSHANEALPVARRVFRKRSRVEDRVCLRLGEKPSSMTTTVRFRPGFC